MTRQSARATVVMVAGLGGWLAVAGLTTSPAAARDPRITSEISSDQVGDVKRTMGGLYVTAREAHALLGQYPDVLLIDVRSRAQVLADGVAAGTHKVVPFLVPSASGESGSFDRASKRINPEFLGRIERLAGTGAAGRARTILVICPDGSHSALAVDHLTDNGYGRVYLIVDGTGSRTGAGGEGWKAMGLPWLAAPLAAQLD